MTNYRHGQRVRGHDCALSMEDRRKAADMYLAGYKIRDVAAEFNRSYTTMRQHLLNQGVTLRPGATRTEMSKRH